MLVDDHAVVRSGLGAFLLAFDDLELVGEAGSGDEEQWLFLVLVLRDRLHQPQPRSRDTRHQRSGCQSRLYCLYRNSGRRRR
jgi:hypothetical protein